MTISKGKGEALNNIDNDGLGRFFFFFFYMSITKVGRGKIQISALQFINL